ncbi:MAG: aminotransferase class V-fold PLP-dependent enzyme [Bifidobacterium sp.]|uniref:aminotransferase class V-fold PLP-dependent enzyme n=1 Tax=Bifidobacterium sp. TaxID=41200 RepID=UPI0039EC5BF1
MAIGSTVSHAPDVLVTRDGRSAPSLWNLDPHVVHINHGSFGAVPSNVLEYQDRLKASMEAAPVGWFGSAPERIGLAREMTARFLGVDPDLTAFVPNASGGASVIENCMELHEGDEILVTDHGYGAVVMGAQRKARACGAHVIVVHIPLGASDDEIVADIAEKLSERTALVIVDQITSPTATVFPVAEIAALAHGFGAKILVDGAHVPCLLPIRPDIIGADFWIGNLHKFACAPRGCAVLVASPDAAQDLYPLIDSWWYEKPFPQRFDMQGTLDQTSFLTAPYALNYIEETVGWDQARAYIESMVCYGQDVIASAFEKITGDSHHVALPSPAPAMRLVKLPSPLANNHDDADLLRDHVFEKFHIEAAFTSFDSVGYLRLSAHIYNLAQDYQQFAEVCVPELCAWAEAGKTH